MRVPFQMIVFLAGIGASLAWALGETKHSLTLEQSAFESGVHQQYLKLGAKLTDAPFFDLGVEVKSSTYGPLAEMTEWGPGSYLQGGALIKKR